MIYKRDWQVISNLESLQASWDGSKSSTKKAKDVSWAFKDLAMNYWNTWGWTTDVWKRAGQGLLFWANGDIEIGNFNEEPIGKFAKLNTQGEIYLVQYTED